MNAKMLHDAQGIERCRKCAEEMNGYLKKERQSIENKILDLSREQGYIESHINVLELQQSRPPARQVTLPAPVLCTRKKMIAALKAQSQLISFLLQAYTNTQIEMVSCGAIVTDTWHYDKDIEQHKNWMKEAK